MSDTADSRREDDHEVERVPVPEPAVSEEPTIVESLGMEISVTNPAVADALRAEADPHPSSDTERLHTAPPSAEEIREVRAEVEQALPDVLIAAPTPHDTEEARLRVELRQQVATLGEALGYLVEPDGTWRMSDGTGILVRSITTVSSPGGAADILAKICLTLDSGGAPCEALIVTRDQPQADLISAQILSRDSRHRIRVSALSTLKELATLYTAGRIGHQVVRALLVPSAQIDPITLLVALRPLF